MPEDLKWLFGLVVVVLGFLFGGIVYSDSLRHVERMECIKAKGEYIKDTCVFR